MSAKKSRIQVDEAFYAEDPNQLENVKAFIEEAKKNKKYSVIYNHRLNPETRSFLKSYGYRTGFGYISSVTGEWEVEIRW